MYRDAMSKLYEWKKERRRRPLLLHGARRVGKSWLMETFGNEAYPLPPIVLNFERNKKHTRFLLDENGEIRSPEDTIRELKKAYGDFEPDSRLIIFDEIQLIENGLSRLKFFMDDYPEYHVISGGSLLGLSLGSSIGEFGFPVGVAEMEIHPMTFYEFLMASGKCHLAEMLENGEWGAIRDRHEEFECDFWTYCMVGGMPSAVREYLDSGNFERVRQVQEEIFDQYDRDFLKHGGDENEVLTIKRLWNEIPKQLGEKNERFLFGLVRQGGRYSNHERALEWLKDAGMVTLVRRTTDTGHEMTKTTVDHDVKVYMVDVGLATAALQYDAEEEINAVLSGNMNMASYGWIAEQFVLQELVAMGKRKKLAYWHDVLPKTRFECEIDLLLYRKGQGVPIEVKSVANYESASFDRFRECFSPRQSVRASMRRAGIADGVWTIPLFAVGGLDRFLDIQSMPEPEQKNSQSMIC